MELQVFLNQMPPSFPQQLRQLADLLEGNKQRVRHVNNENPKAVIFVSRFLAPGVPNESKLLSQSEILIYLGRQERAEEIRIGPKQLSQLMKQMGYPYADSFWDRTEKRAKRGFWIDFL